MTKLFRKIKTNQKTPTTMQEDIVKPIQKNDRIDYLDILRGMAILFIYSANILFFSGIWFPPANGAK